MQEWFLSVFYLTPAIREFGYLIFLSYKTNKRIGKMRIEFIGYSLCFFELSIEMSVFYVFKSSCFTDRPEAKHSSFTCNKRRAGKPIIFVKNNNNLNILKVNNL